MTTINTTVIRNTMALINRVQDNAKPNTDGYVTNKELISFLAENTGVVYGKSKTRQFLIGKLDEYMITITEAVQEEAQTEEPASNPFPVSPAMPKNPLDDDRYDVDEEDLLKPSDQTEPDVYSVDYWWNASNATKVLKRCIEQAARNNKQDFISMHMVRSFVLEMMFGKQLTEWVDKKKVINFSKETTPAEWKVSSDFCNKLFQRYMHSYKGGCIINSEEMCWFYRHVSYAIQVKGVKVIYDLNWETKTLVRRDTAQSFTLDEAAFKKIDETCGLNGIRR